ncbi:hypothetical protein FACS189429_3710 [Bacteroidia bacterium]|nr:hypothetical protein FACS189429_3710 [Bacteroidia bacterium]GHV44291.1 hypothetical protein FACS1894180_5460 [Bacteroidia bacterium]
MKKIYLLLIFVLAAATAAAQGAYGGTQLFDVRFADGVTWAASGSHSFQKNGYTFSVEGIGSVSDSRIGNFNTINSTTPTTQVNFTGAVKCTSVEISEMASLGELTLAIQNGSSGNPAALQVQVFDGAVWVLADEITLTGNERTLWKAANVLTKSAVKVKFVFPFQCWFYGVSAYNHANEGAGAPTFVSANPAANSNISSGGEILLQFDELLKTAASPTATLGNATVTAITCNGNTVKIAYNGFTNAANPLVLTANSVTDFSGTPLATDAVVQYQQDNTAPAFVSISPEDSSTIHIGDLGEDARKIKLTFSEEISDVFPEIANYGFQFGNGATNASIVPLVNGNVLILSYSGLAYNSTNTLTVPSGIVTDLSGNAWVGGSFTFYTGERDNTPPVLVRQTYQGFENFSGSFSYEFDEIVVVKNQSATFDNGASVYLSNNGKVIGVNWTQKGDGFSLTIPAGAITDTCGNEFGEIVDGIFGPAVAIPFQKPFTSIVTKDGSGDYTTIQAAVDAASGTERTLIFVTNGTYNEKLAILKDKVSLIGESADGVVISWNECATTSTLQDGTGINSTGTDASYTMLIRGNDFYGENFTVKNTYDYANGNEANKQAVAIEHITGDRHVLKNVKMYSYQDTYYPKSSNTRQYLVDCVISGGTDFIFGSGTAFIDSSKIECVSGGQYITAASDTEKEFGIVLKNNEITYSDIVMDTKKQFYLGRPWKIPAKTSYINNKFENNLLRPEGWSVWSGSPENHLSAVYNEFGNTLLDGTALDVSQRVWWSNQLTTAQAERYNPDNAFNYGYNNVWNPYAATALPPSFDIVNCICPTVNGNVISWANLPFAAGYMVFVDGRFLANVTGTSYTDLTDYSAYYGLLEYTVVPYNEYGAMGEGKQAVPTGIANIETKSGFLKNTLISNELELKNAENFVSVEIISANGAKIFTAKAAEKISVNNLSAGFYIAKGYATNGDIFVDKILKK